MFWVKKKTKKHFQPIFKKTLPFKNLYGLMKLTALGKKYIYHYLWMIKSYYVFFLPGEGGRFENIFIFFAVVSYLYTWSKSFKMLKTCLKSFNFWFSM